MNEADNAVSLFSQGFTCSQAVLLAYASRFGLDAALAARLASPFGGGIARQGRVCGAVAGAVMVAGLEAGNATVDQKEMKEAMYVKVRDLMARFAEAHGSTECRLLTGFDMATPEGHAAATEARVFTEKCPAFVRTAAMLAGEIRR